MMVRGQGVESQTYILHLQRVQKIGAKRGCIWAYFQTLKLDGEGFKSQKETPTKKPP